MLVRVRAHAMLSCARVREIFAQECVSAVLVSVRACHAVLALCAVLECASSRAVLMHVVRSACAGGALAQNAVAQCLRARVHARAYVRELLSRAGGCCVLMRVYTQPATYNFLSNTLLTAIQLCTLLCTIVSAARNVLVALSRMAEP